MGLTPDTVCHWAREEGFEMCRIARPRLDPAHARRLREWIAAGMHAGMTWMAEASRLARRLDPARLAPGMRSVVVVGLRHAPPPYGLDDALRARGRGVIAAYAFGDDYHAVMKARLKRLARRIEAAAGGDHRVYVDTAPLFETALAERAGIGWIGKHSLVLNRRWGSWFLLGALFTTHPLAPDPPASAHCGSCARCIEACPTGAIVAPGVVDAHRCLSYWTIEHKGFLPRWVRERLGNRIYGCDDCQLVCPWNAKAVPRAWEADLLAPRRERVLPPLAELLELDARAFRDRFRNSAIRRIGRARFVRNCAVAAAHAGDPALCAPLIRLLGDAEPVVRAHAGWSLLHLARAGGETERARAAVRAALDAERDPAVRADLAASLAHG